MSLLAALAKGIGAGTVDNAKVGFAEQQRQREAIQRKEEMGVEFDRRDAQIRAQIDAGIADTETRLAAAATENEKARQSEWDMMEKRLGAGLAKAAASANAAARGSAAKSMLSHLDELDKYRMEIDKIPDDQITPERRDQIHAQLDMQRYLIASNPNAQALAAEYDRLKPQRPGAGRRVWRIGQAAVCAVTGAAAIRASSRCPGLLAPATRGTCSYAPPW